VLVVSDVQATSKLPLYIITCKQYDG